MHAPSPQFLNEPRPSVAVNATTVPPGKLAEQLVKLPPDVLPHWIPAGLLPIAPRLGPMRLTVSCQEAEGVQRRDMPPEPSLVYVTEMAPCERLPTLHALPPTESKSQSPRPGEP